MAPGETKDSIKEGDGAISVRIFCGELNILVNGITGGPHLSQILGT